MSDIPYRNLFSEYLGKTDSEVREKLDVAWQQLFYGDDENQRIYYPEEDDRAYILDVGSNDVRSEGMSYGMMIALQMNRKAEFNRIWKWARSVMYVKSGTRKGYFGWTASRNGTVSTEISASDGEIWFAMALYLASGRWGSGEGIFNYRQEADDLLYHMVYKTGDPDTGREEDAFVTSIFDKNQKQVVFVPFGDSAGFTDPSYHLPAFTAWWAKWAKEEKDRKFFADVTETSRELFRRAAHPETGLMPDYSEFDGRPKAVRDHDHFRHDAWRTLGNVGLDYAWFRADPWQVGQSNRVLKFLLKYEMNEAPQEFTLEGVPRTAYSGEGLYAMAAVAALAADESIGRPFVANLWEMEIPEGQWRYYNSVLYFLALLQVSGEFRIYEPEPAS